MEDKKALLKKEKLTFGRFKGETIWLMDSPDKIQYLFWLKESQFEESLTTLQKEAINYRLYGKY